MLQAVNIPTVFLSLTSLAIGFMPHAARAGCPCERGGGEAMMPMPVPTYQAAPSQYPAYAGMVQGPRPLTASPPPGSLGQTYWLPSREIPADKHPRVGMVDVHVRGATSVRLLNINPHREEDDVEGFQAEGNNSLWRFETKPLMPGVPHIYKVIVRFSAEPNAPETVRIIRLIPGRIVELIY